MEQRTPHDGAHTGGCHVLQQMAHTHARARTHTHTHTRTHTHTHTHARTRACMHAHTHDGAMYATGCDISKWALSV